jgi:hypothetical protein
VRYLHGDWHVALDGIGLTSHPGEQMEITHLANRAPFELSGSVKT